MHPFVSFNQKIQSSDKTNLHAVSAAAFYGRGVFTTLAIYRRKPFLWEKHWRRLIENASRIRLDLSEFSEEKIKAALADVINRNNAENARARITFFDESTSGIWSFETNRRTSVLITTADLRETKDLRLTVSPYRINSKSPLANIKSCNYLENVLALEEAKARDFDEAVRLNERGEVASACMANLFWIKSGKIFTAALETGCLAGTTREFLLENSRIEEKITTLDELIEADEIFLTSSGIGIGKATSFNKKILENTAARHIEKEFSHKRENL
ncbi:MAG TPA: aminotransferase class IV [Pyrinomonadaceae bacterium]|jgi:branched-subunit amino acid aminotransferase/4-amino-4-deoxychorismate lyase